MEVQRALATLGNTYYAQADAEAPSPSRGLLDKAEKKFLQALQACLELHGSSDLNESEFMAMKCRLFLNLGNKGCGCLRLSMSTFVACL